MDTSKSMKKQHNEAQEIEKDIIQLRSKAVRYIHAYDQFIYASRDLAMSNESKRAHFKKLSSGFESTLNIKYVLKNIEMAKKRIMAAKITLRKIGKIDLQQLEKEIANLKKRLDGIAKETGYEITHDQKLFCLKCNRITIHDKWLYVSSPLGFGGGQFSYTGRKCTVCKEKKHQSKIAWLGLD